MPTTLPSSTLTTGTVRELLGVLLDAEVAGQERAAAAGDAAACRPRCAPELSWALLSPSFCCSGTIAATLPPPDEPSSRRIDGTCSCIDSRSRWRLLAPMAPSAWPPRDVKSSAQTTAVRPSIVPHPPTWLAGRERRRCGRRRRRWRSRRGCRPRGTSRRRAAGRCARGRSACRGCAGARRPGPSSPGARRAAARPCSAATSSSTGSHVSSRRRLEAAGDVARARRRRRPGPGPPRRPAAAAARAPTTPAHGAVTTVSIFIALTTIRASPASTSSPTDARTSTTTPPIGLAHALLAGVDVEPERRDVRRRGRAGRVERSSSGAAWRDRRRPRRRRRELGRLGEQRRAGVAAPDVGVGEDRRQLGEVRRQPADVELVDGPPGPVDGVGDVGGRRPCRSPWPAAGRTAAAARSRRSRRRRRARRARTAPCRR